MSFDTMISTFESNTICYVYPNGEIIIAQKRIKQEQESRADLSQISHSYAALQKLNRYKNKIQQHLENNRLQVNSENLGHKPCL